MAVFAFRTIPNKPFLNQNYSNLCTFFCFVLVFLQFTFETLQFYSLSKFSFNFLKKKKKCWFCVVRHYACTCPDVQTGVYRLSTKSLHHAARLLQAPCTMQVHNICCIINSKYQSFHWHYRWFLVKLFDWRSRLCENVVPTRERTSKQNMIHKRNAISAWSMRKRRHRVSLFMQMAPEIKTVSVLDQHRIVTADKTSNEDGITSWFIFTNSKEVHPLSWKRTTPIYGS